MDERTSARRIGERALDTTVSGGIAGAVVMLGAHYFQPDMPVPVTVAWTVVLNALGAAVLKWLRVRVGP